jgi:D-aminopeptidase
MEGVAGIVDWDQCRPSGGPQYAVGCRLLLGEVDAAIEGALAGGVERMRERTVGIRDDDLLALYSTFVAVAYITRQAGER